MSSPDTASDSTWNSERGFIWSLIGSAVGFANILSFSAQAYKNGGGAYLIPYCIALILLGFPFLILEGIIGDRLKSPLVSAYGQVWGKVGKTLGWLAVIACLSIGAFYVVLTGYSVAYIYFSATNSIPMDTKEFFVHSFLKSTDGLTQFGGLSLPIFIATVVVSIVTWFVLVRNIKDGIEKFCSLFMPLLAFMMVAFAVFVAFLPGGINGWAYYLQPNFAKLLDAALWRDVFGQLFFSLSLGLGIIVGYSRHTGESHSIARAMKYVIFGDFMVSFIAGAAIFGCLAHISHVQNIPFESILENASTFEIGFVVFPQLLKFFGPILSPIIGVIFFFCIFIAGITGFFSIVESAVGNVEVEYRTTRKSAVTGTLLVVTALSAFFCMGNASYVMDALIPMVIGINMLIGGLALILAFHYSCPTLSNDPIWQSTSSMHAFSRSLRYVAPALLGIILIGNLSQEFTSWDLLKGVRWGWFTLAFAASYALMHFSEKRALVYSSN